MSAITLARSPSPLPPWMRSPTPPPPPVSSPPRDDSPPRMIGPIENPAVTSSGHSEDEIAALLDPSRFSGDEAVLRSPRPRPKRVRQTRRLAQVTQGPPRRFVIPQVTPGPTRQFVIRPGDASQEGGVVRTQRIIPTRGPAVQGMRLGFHAYTPEQKHWIHMHTQETQDYINTHSDMTPFYLDIWRRFTNEYPAVFHPPYPLDEELVHAYNLSKGKSLTTILRHTWSFRNFGRVHREETPEWGAGAIAGSST